MKFVCTTDWHLDKLERLFPNALDLQYNEICKPFNYAIEHGIKTVWVAGDICENPELSPQAMTTLIRILTKYDKKVNIHIILGNHDFASTDTNSLQPIQTLIKRNRLKVKVFDKPTHVVIEGVNFNALPFPYGSREKAYKGTSLNICHLEWVGAMRDNGKSRIKEGHSKTNGRDFWIMGHLHTPQYLEKPRVLYVGTQYQTNFGENEDKSFCVVEACYRGSELKVEFKRVAQRQAFRLINLVVTDAKQLAQVTDNPLHLYKLHMKDIRPPKSWLLSHPNVVSITGIAAEVEEAAQSATKAGQQFDRRTVVRSMLKEKGLDKPQVKRAFGIMQELNIRV